MKEYIIRVCEKKAWDGSQNVLESKELVRCKDCEYSYAEGFINERLLCEKHPELGSLPADWFCADYWKA